MASSPGSSRFGPDRRTALAIWWLSRLSVVVLTVVSAHTLNAELPRGWTAMVARWQHWDADYYLQIARHGYSGTVDAQPSIVAFMPGFPMAVRIVHVVVRNWTLAALTVSAISGSVAAMALSGLGSYEKSSNNAQLSERAVLYLVVSPFAVFLAAGYSETLFLAFALPAWLAARKGNWRAAGVLAGLSATVRITGLFLGIALLVEYLVMRRRAGEPLLKPDALWLLGPFIGTGLYFGYLGCLTGDPLAWVHAQGASPWPRHLTLPWHALKATVDAARDGNQPVPYAWAFGVEIAVVAVGLVLFLVLIKLRRWGETVYVGVQWLSFALSQFYLSVGRASLLWWPMWLLLARASINREWVHRVYLAIAPALMATYVIAFTSGGWVG